MAPNWDGRVLSSDWSYRKRRYDIVIVGSGYGGAIAAARIAASGAAASICVLERGMEWPVGTFPDNLAVLSASRRSAENPIGLFELLRFGRLTVIQANGLGGGSLLDAGVARTPSPEAFTEFGWPRSLSYQSLSAYYQRARQMLAASTHPDAGQLRKVAALNRRAAELSTASTPVELAINFALDGVNPHGVIQKRCTGCGDCMTGCNVGAKNTLCTNYLALARAWGAEMYTQAEVEWVERTPAGWKVHGRRYYGSRPTAFSIETGNVILAAGAVHSTAILMRSSARGLTVSPALGSNLAASLDSLGCSYNGREPANAVGFGAGGKGKEPVGPAVAATLRYVSPLPGVPSLTISDCSIPSAMAVAARPALALMRGERPEEEDAAARGRMLRDLLPQTRGRDAALKRTMMLLASGMAQHSGQMVLRQRGRSRARPDISWDPQPFQALWEPMNAELRRHARALGGTFIQSPLAFVLDTHLATIHPAGGCPVGETYERGAVDEFGRVFAGDGSVHEGLFVMDGALLPPRATESPMLTICALAERNSERLVRALRGEPYRQPIKAAAPPRVNAALFSSVSAGRYVVKPVEETEPVERWQAPKLAEAQPLVFVNYRRADASPYATHIAFRLRAESDEGQVFFDIEAEDPGADFGEKIERVLERSAVLVAVVGGQWAIRRRHGVDWVAREIEIALRKKLKILPVLVDGAKMPPEHELPAKIAGFARREALEIRPERSAEDLARLIAVVRAACPCFGAAKREAQI